MTLNTGIYIKTSVSPQDTHEFINKNLLKAPHAKYTDEAEISWSTKEPTGIWSLDNECGQGFPAWLMMSYRPGEELHTEDVYDDDQGDRWLVSKACTFSVNFDTAYGYRDGGLGCGDLHARYIAELYRWLISVDPNSSLVWHNEFTGDYFDNLDGLDTLGDAGDEAREWMVGTALPAVAAKMVEDMWKANEESQFGF
jgi:hypothetical protein